MSNRLPIHNMHERHRALTPAIAASYLEAARVCLSRHHQSPTDFSLSDNGEDAVASLEWDAPDNRAIGAWANMIDATEAGAYCCAIAGLEQVRDLRAVRRAETGTGADYYVGPVGAGEDDLEECQRLEVSGVDAGPPSAVRQRLGEKVEQARAGNSSLPATAGVVGFGAKLIVIQDVPEIR
jgi:hypothetical protein